MSTANSTNVGLVKRSPTYEFFNYFDIAANAYNRALFIQAVEATINCVKISPIINPGMLT